MFEQVGTMCDKSTVDIITNRINSLLFKFNLKLLHNLMQPGLWN